MIRGCVPKKLLVYASHFAEDFEDARGFGWDRIAKDMVNLYFKVILEKGVLRKEARR